MITIAQCRGARGLLGWTQQDLADASGLSKTAINNFEKGHSDIKTESLRAIRMAFESADAEFIDSEGVSIKTETYKTFRGQTALNELIDDIHLTLNQKPEAEILISFVDQSLAGRVTTQKLFKHIEFLKDHNIKQRILSFTGSKQVLSPTDECRWIDTDNRNTGTTTYLYGDKVAIELWDKSTIIVARSKDASSAERGRFEQLWHNALIPSESGNKTQQALKNHTQKSGA